MNQKPIKINPKKITILSQVSTKPKRFELSIEKPYTKKEAEFLRLQILTHYDQIQSITKYVTKEMAKARTALKKPIHQIPIDELEGKMSALQDILKLLK